LPQLSLHTPVGPITVSAEDEAIVSVDWGWGRDQQPTPLLSRAKTWLQAYFDGQMLPMDLPLDPFGTAYRRHVWSTVAGIAPGETWSYRRVAEAAGGSPRSIGTAMAHNPIPILIPCHRVVGSGPKGRLVIGGYSSGEGIETKRFLLNLEASATGHPSLPLLPSEEVAASVSTSQQRITR
jgi:methylated-DNA-[protein]-cysteine S-methyltransferase